jgi:hypothetical protein
MAVPQARNLALVMVWREQQEGKKRAKGLEPSTASLEG